MFCDYFCKSDGLLFKIASGHFYIRNIKLFYSYANKINYNYRVIITNTNTYVTTI